MSPATWRYPEQQATAVIIGGGQAGLATSNELSALGVDHVVLERGEVANSWRTERWDSLRLLTPNWQTRLPGYAYHGNDPDGFMSAGEVADFIGAYASFCNAPVHTDTCVKSVAPAASGYRVETNRGSWQCRAVVVASGPYNRPAVPRVAAALPDHITQLTAQHYRNPAQLADGGVLVVGAAATGAQIAREIQASGRQVTLAVGEHLRLPRMYRGRDIQYWMHATGLLDERYCDVDDLNRVRSLPSPQLLGHPDRCDLDLNTLAEQGVRCVGRLVGVQGCSAQFSGALANMVKMSELKMQRLLRAIDDWISASGVDEFPQPASTPAPVSLRVPPTLGLDLQAERIHTVIWATGFRPDYTWLKVPVLDRKGRLCHDGGITAAPGLYAMGLPFMRKRKSAFIFGAADDASEIAEHLATFVRREYRRRVCVG
jgi:putative flavoprotein involved in K+ transport